jgi:hypothetical protein
MSLTINPQNVVRVLDPIININNERQFAILEGGSQVSWKPFTTTSISNSAIQFSCPPPSPQIIVNRKLYIVVPMRVTLNAPTNTQPKLLRANFDAPRAWSFSSICNTVQVGINNTSVSVNMSDVIHPLLRFNTDVCLKEGFYSTTPSSLDQSVNYSDLQGYIRNPLSQYGDSNEEGVMARGGFPFNVVSDNGVTAVVDFLIAEPLFLSPFYFGKENAGGFYGVQTMDFTFNILANSFARVWSHDYSAGNALITSGSVQFNNFAGGFSPQFGQSAPLLLFNYITPKELMNIPKSVTYPYFDIQRYPTDTGSIVAGMTNAITSNNLQLQSIPRRIYVFARVSNAVQQTNNSYTDSYLPISSINVNWNNQNSLLSNLTAFDLYLMAKKNHYCGTWTDWSGQPVYADGSLTTKISTSGSICCLEMGTDIGLYDGQCAGMLGTYQLNIILTVTNNTSVAVAPTLYVITINEGTFTIENNRSISQIGVVSKNDVLNAQTNMSPFVDYYEIQDVNGGDFFSGLKNFGTRVRDWIKNAYAKGKDIYEKVKPYAETAYDIAKYAAPLLGFGEGEGCDDMENMQDMHHGSGPMYASGELVGGKMMNRRKLASRMKRG